MADFALFFFRFDRFIGLVWPIIPFNRGERDELITAEVLLRRGYWDVFKDREPDMPFAIFIPRRGDMYK